MVVKDCRKVYNFFVRVYIGKRQIISIKSNTHLIFCNAKDWLGVFVLSRRDIKKEDRTKKREIENEESMRCIT